MLPTCTLTASVFVILAGVCAAQSINIDVGIHNAVPQPSFGGVANQPGVWNRVSAGPGSTALAGVDGASTNVTIARTAGIGGNFHQNHPGTAGDVELLLDDAEDLHPFSTWTVSGLAAGPYTITTYAWAPEGGSDFLTGVKVNGGTETIVGGPWTSSGFVRGGTHAVDTLVLAAGADLVIELRNVNDYATFNGLQIQEGISPFTAYCAGDYSATQCPCGNPGISGSGCASSVSPGARLSGSGTPSIASDTVVLTGSGMPNGPVLYFQGTLRQNGGFGSLFGDGLLCAGGALTRLGIKTNAAGTSNYPGVGDPALHIQGSNVTGDTRRYQCWYRDSAAFCMPTTFNLSNGLETTWVF